jgi:hypothetical protein
MLNPPAAAAAAAAPQPAHLFHAAASTNHIWLAGCLHMISQVRSGSSNSCSPHLRGLYQILAAAIVLSLLLLLLWLCYAWLLEAAASYVECLFWQQLFN